MYTRGSNFPWLREASQIGQTEHSTAAIPIDPSILAVIGHRFIAQKRTFKMPTRGSEAARAEPETRNRWGKVIFFLPTFFYCLQQSIIPFSFRDWREQFLNRLLFYHCLILNITVHFLFAKPNMFRVSSIQEELMPLIHCAIIVGLYFGQLVHSSTKKALLCHFVEGKKPAVALAETAERTFVHRGRFECIHYQTVCSYCVMHVRQDEVGRVPSWKTKHLNKIKLKMRV